MIFQDGVGGYKFAMGGTISPYYYYTSGFRGGEIVPPSSVKFKFYVNRKYDVIFF